MPETPDFDLIAMTVLRSMGIYEDGVSHLELGDQLRMAWNARGAADIATLEAALSSLMGATASGPYIKNLDRALRTLDR